MRAITAITCNKYNSHTEPLFKILNTLKLEDMRKQQFKFLYRLINNNVPLYFTFTLLGFVGNYYYKTKKTLRAPKIKHDLCQQNVASELKDPICHSDECQIGSFSSEATKCFVILFLCYAMQVLDPYLHSEDGFVLFIKKYMKSSYSITCTVLNFYICKHNYI